MLEKCITISKRRSSTEIHYTVQKIITAHNKKVAGNFLDQIRLSLANLWLGYIYFN